MRVLAAQNADVTITKGGTAVAVLVANVIFQVDNRPAESDIPSGAFFIWPLKEGTLSLEYTCEPGVAPHVIYNGAVSPTVESIVVNAKSIGGASITFTIPGYLTGVTSQTATNEVGMPVQKEQILYTVLTDDTQDSDYLQ